MPISSSNHPKIIWSNPAVLIFGAGATRGGLEGRSFPPPPIDNDFFNISGQLEGHGTSKVVHRVLQSVWELYGKTNGISLEKYYRDIETREVIGTFAKTANQPKNWKARRIDLEELIRRVYIHTTCERERGPFKPQKSRFHRGILSRIKTNDTIITFNYDLLIEESMGLNQLWNPIYGYGVKVQGKTHDWCRKWLETRRFDKVKKAKILLLKLHGSLNWNLYNNKNIRLKPHPYVVRTKNKKPTFDKVSILPPGWNKQINKKPYKSFWKFARLKLEKCKTIIILGYSLPETDLLAQSLISEVVRLRKARENYIKELHLADPSGKVREKFIQIFTPALGPHGKIFQYYDLKDFYNRITGSKDYKTSFND